MSIRRRGQQQRSGPNDPSVPLSSTTLAEWLSGGRRAAGVDVSERTVYGLPAYMRAVTLTAGTVAQLPLKVYRNGTRTRILQRTVLDNPNPRQTPAEFWLTQYANALTWGNCYAWKRRSPAGVVQQAWPIHPSRVKVLDGEPTDTNPSGKTFLVRDSKGAYRPHTDWDVFHLPYISPDGVAGLSAVQAFTQSLGIGLAAERASGEFFANGNMLAGILSAEMPLSEDGAGRLKRRWRETVGRGPASTGDVAVLDSGVKFTPISIPPKDAELLASRKFTVEEVGRMFGIPNHLLGAEVASSWGTGIESLTLAWVKFGLSLWLTLGEQRVTRELLPGGWSGGSWFAEYALEGLLRGDSQSRAEFYASAVQWGWMSRNEVRALENREQGPPELDDFLTPLNFTSTGQAGADVSELTRMLQQIYLAVGKVITVEEARELLNRVGADLPDSPGVALPFSSGASEGGAQDGRSTAPTRPTPVVPGWDSYAAVSIPPHHRGDTDAAVLGS